ncbi:MAG: hypothetical protein K6G60_08015 [Lachnospiraceae bacterium]|nr:hypothetical protein [Lachnospiraceae bacterium]
MNFKKISGCILTFLIVSVFLTRVTMGDSFAKDINKTFSLFVYWFIAMFILSVVILGTLYGGQLLTDPQKRKDLIEKRQAAKLAKKYPYKATLYLNGRFRPQIRQNIEKSLDDFLKQADIGYVTGGQCTYKEHMEVERCEIYMHLFSDHPKLPEKIAAVLDDYIKLPKGTVIECAKSMASVGVLAGLTCYLDVSKMEYNEENNNALMAMLDQLKEKLGDSGALYDSWVASFDARTGEDVEPEEDQYRSTIIGLYFYGNDCGEMRRIIEPVVSTGIFADVYRLEQSC